MENLSRKPNEHGQNSTDSPPDRTKNELESPSLFQSQTSGATQDGAVAFELKFLLTEQQAKDIAVALQGRLAPDPYADPSLQGAYRTTSLYTDTAGFDVYRRNGNHAGTKFRVRRYGLDGPMFLERKDKDGDRVRKIRTTISAGDLCPLYETNAESGVNGHWAGVWFRDAIRASGLKPVCRIGYERIAFMGSTDSGAIRVTFDRNIRGEMTNNWEVAPIREAAELLPGFVIGEFKFRYALPALLKEVVADHRLVPTTISKYRRFINATGCVPQEAPLNHAVSATESGGTADV